MNEFGRPSGRIPISISGDMNLDQATRHFYSVELSNAERLETSAMLDSLRDNGIVTKNMNLGQFVKECFWRGLNDYRKDLVRQD